MAPTKIAHLQDSFFDCIAASFVNLQNKTPISTSKSEITMTKGFSPTKKIHMLGCCGLGLTSDTEIPKIWTDIHDESSKNGKKAILLMPPFDPLTTRDHDINIHASQRDHI
eukprot:scaffold47970_cov43-Attheya_sp.AAC.1